AVLDMLQRFSNAFTSGDGKAAAECWHVPALVLSDNGTMPVNTADDVEQFFGGAADQYHSKGIYGTRPEIREFTPMSRRVASVTVRWPYLDREGAETGAEEASTYLLRLDEAGKPRICVALMLGASEQD